MASNGANIRGPQLGTLTFHQFTDPDLLSRLPSNDKSAREMVTDINAAFTETTIEIDFSAIVDEAVRSLREGTPLQVSSNSFTDSKLDPKAPDRLQTIIGPSWWIRGYTYRAPPESSLINSIFEAWRNSGDPRELKTDVESHNHTGDLEGSYDSQSLRDDTTTIRAVVKK